MSVISNYPAAKKNKLSLTDKAYIELKRRILENGLPPGSQLMEVELAELLNISRTPAREAMTRLEAEGFVERESDSVKRQVRRLILQATSHENLCQSYIGWCPWW